MIDGFGYVLLPSSDVDRDAQFYEDHLGIAGAKGHGVVPVRHPRQSRWLDERDRLKGGRFPLRASEP